MANQKKQTCPTSECFSKASLSSLLKAEWTPERRVSAGVYRSAYKKENITWFKKVEQFLERFGGLIIKYERHGQTDVLDFCADDAAEGTGGTVLTQLENLLEESHLCPIGHYQYGMCMLLMQGKKGWVYGVTDDSTTLVGKSGEEAIDNILRGKEVQLLRSDVSKVLTSKHSELNT